jgi:SAM-dependent methyltransferase
MMKAELYPASRALRCAVAAGFALLAASVALAQSMEDEPFNPESGLIGRDVDWVPTPPVLLEKMLDMVGLKPSDYVIDLGSGDGRNVIAAAKRGAHGHGIEFNPKLVALSRRNAEKEGVADRARFFEGDMFEADLSRADVLPLFLMDENLAQLLPRLLTLKPGTRIVNNGFEIPGWDYDEIGTVKGACGVWCVAYLYIVPAPVEGAWRVADGPVLTLRQEFQWLTGTLSAHGEHDAVIGRVSGEIVRFTIGLARYEARVEGDRMAGQIREGTAARSFSAVRRKLAPR